MLHHAVDIGGQILEALDLLAQFRIEERRQDPGDGTESGGVGAAGLVAHQKRLVAKLHRQRKQRTQRQIDVVIRSVAVLSGQNPLIVYRL